MSMPVKTDHPKGESEIAQIEEYLKEFALDTYAGKVQVSFEEDSDTTISGQMVFFIAYIKVSGLWDKFVNEFPVVPGPRTTPAVDVLGTILLSVLGGHKRYAHITAIRADNVNPRLLGMNKAISSDTVRRSLESVDEDEGIKWLEDSLVYSYGSILTEPWVLDVDTTIKTLYGKQEGLVAGYNPKKPGRPAHIYHTYMIGTLRLILNVEVTAGNKSATNYTAPELWKLLDSLPADQLPHLLRADCAFGNDVIISEAEKRGINYLFKLKQTKNVKKEIIRTAGKEGWSDAGSGWSGCVSEVALLGWESPRKIIVLRRLMRKPITALEASKVKALKDAAKGDTEVRGYQFELPFYDLVKGDFSEYEYVVLVTSLNDDVRTIAQLYRDRADSENGFDELKNQWGWGGYATQDIKRCRFMARIVGLVYNWWNLFARLGNPDKHMEAISSRPLLLHGVGRQTEHAGQTRLKISSMHGLKKKVIFCFNRIAKTLNDVLLKARHLTKLQIWNLILSKALVKFLNGRNLNPKTLIQNQT